MVGERNVQKRFELLTPWLDERLRRLVAAAEAEAIGYGGVTQVARTTGISRRTIHAGLTELRNAKRERPAGIERVRRAGGGRKKTVDKDPGLRSSLDALLEPVASGLREGPLRWTCKSIRRLAQELVAMGHSTSHRMVADLLREEGYSLQANRKNLTGAGLAARRHQFRYVNEAAREVLAARDPVAFVDVRRRPSVGDLAAGRRVRPINVGIDEELAEYAAATIRRWWRRVGLKSHPAARRLLIAADCAGRGDSAAAPWKSELQRFADDFNLAVTVCYMPPGTLKWSKIEGVLLATVTENRRERCSVCHEIAVGRVAETLHGPARMDESGTADPALSSHSLPGDWNYTLLPS